MDKNTIIALVLIGIVLLLWPLYMKKVVGIQEPVPVESDSTAIVHDSVQTGQDQKVSSGSMDVIPKHRLSDRSEKQSSLRPDTLLINTDLIQARLSSLGGGTIVGYRLKNYFKQAEDRKSPKETVELILPDAYGNLALDIGNDLSDRIFQVSFDTSGAEKIVRYSLDLDHKTRIEKEYHFFPTEYRIGLMIKLIGFSRKTLLNGFELKWNTGLASSEVNKSRKDDLLYYQAYALQGGELLKTKEKSTEKREGITDWVAVRNKYFIVAMIPRDAQGIAAELEGSKINNDPDGWRVFQTSLTLPYTGAAEEIRQVDVYLGPLDYALVRGLKARLEKTMNFGWLIIQPFSIAFFYTLQFLYQFLRSYGWAIIVFSIIIKILLFPLTRKSMQSMREMQEIQPKIKALQEKFKKDPQRLNQETMKLYKEHGVNPMGGCLPLLLQMPVLFALFNLFRTTIMLRQASFLGVIHDLSAPDAILGGVHLLPILMGVTMIFQQRLSPQDPKQKAMAYFMPIFMVVIFYNLSSGLNLYYFMFNILSIIESVITKRHK